MTSDEMAKWGSVVESVAARVSKKSSAAAGVNELKQEGWLVLLDHLAKDGACTDVPYVATVLYRQLTGHSCRMGSPVKLSVNREYVELAGLRSLPFDTTRGHSYGGAHTEGSQNPLMSRRARELAAHGFDCVMAAASLRGKKRDQMLAKVDQACKLLKDLTWDV